jgi:hypothetical protein
LLPKNSQYNRLAGLPEIAGVQLGIAAGGWRLVEQSHQPPTPADEGSTMSLPIAGLD